MVTDVVRRDEAEHVGRGPLDVLVHFELHGSPSYAGNLHGEP